MREDLEARIFFLENLEKIKRLKASYCYYVDKENLEGLMELFTEDASIDFGIFGKHKGWEAVKKFFKDIVLGELSFNLHMVHNPIIEINGDKATGKWYFEVPSIERKKERAIWIAGIYEEKYVKENEKWMFSFIKADFKFYSPYEEGWAKKNLVKK